jgi:hypothetical protein
LRGDQQDSECQDFHGRLDHPFRTFSIDERARLNDTTPVRQRLVTGLAGALPFVIFKGWGFRFRDYRECGVGSPKIPTLAKTARTGHPVQRAGAVGQFEIPVLS